MESENAFVKSAVAAKEEAITLLMEEMGDKSKMYTNAIKVLEYDKGKQFAAEFLPRIIDC